MKMFKKYKNNRKHNTLQLSRYIQRDNRSIEHEIY